MNACAVVYVFIRILICAIWKNAVLQPPISNFQIRQTICDTLFVRFSNMATNQATVIAPFPVTIGLRVVYITRYVIRIKKYLHNGIEIMEIESNRKEYESLHPYITMAGLHVTSRWPSWWSRTKAILSSGNKNPFPCKFFGKKSILLYWPAT